ncbi:UNVERIFIED_ORG: hypothetical protein BCL66_13512 [Martelella mediterranea]
MAIRLRSWMNVSAEPALLSSRPSMQYAFRNWRPANSLSSVSLSRASSQTRSHSFAMVAIWPSMIETASTSLSRKLAAASMQLFSGCCHVKFCSRSDGTSCKAFRRCRLRFSRHRTLRGDGNELFVQRGGGTELKSNCGSLSAWQRIVATLLEICDLAWFAPVFETAGDCFRPDY